MQCPCGSLLGEKQEKHILYWFCKYCGRTERKDEKLQPVQKAKENNENKS